MSLQKTGLVAKAFRQTRLNEIQFFDPRFSKTKISSGFRSRVYKSNKLNNYERQSLIQKSTFSPSNNQLFVRFYHSSQKLRASGADQVVDGVVQFNLADIGEGIAECEIMKWYVKEGDQIEQFGLLCEVQSDKASVEITSRYDGIIEKVYYKEGDMAKVGSPLVDIRMEGEASAPKPAEKAPEQAKPTAPKETPSTSAARSATTPGGPILASPATKHLARQHNVPLSEIVGTGRGGMVTKGDLLKYLDNRGKTPTPAPQPTSTPTIQTILEDKVVPLSGYSKAMAKTMMAANAIPHFGYKDEVIMDALVKLRDEFKKIAEEKGIKFSYMPLILKAASLALKEYPILNSSYDEAKGALIYKSSHNIGIAVDSPNGLIVPNVKNVEQRSLLDIASEINRLAAAAKAGSVSRDDLTGGTFTISNIGTIGGTYASPVLVVPEVAIGAIGKIQKLPRFDKNNNVVPQYIMNVSWSADHRVIDGATMARFSNLWKKYLENPALMLMQTR